MERHVLACSYRATFLSAAITTEPLSVTLGCATSVFARVVIAERSERDARVPREFGTEIGGEQGEIVAL